MQVKLGKEKKNCSYFFSFGNILQVDPASEILSLVKILFELNCFVHVED